MEVWPRRPCLQDEDEGSPIDYREEDIRPAASYRQLITEAIAAIEPCKGDKILLSDIYAYLKENYAFFRNSDSSWKVCVCLIPNCASALAVNLLVESVQFQRKPSPSALAIICFFSELHSSQSRAKQVLHEGAEE